MLCCWRLRSLIHFITAFCHRLRLPPSPMPRQRRRQQEPPSTGGILPGMYEEAPVLKKARRANPHAVGGRPTQRHFNNNRNVAYKAQNKPKENSLAKPAIFDFISSFQDPPDIPAHLEVQRNLVNQRRGIRHAFRGQQHNKDWFTDPEELIKAPFYTTRETSRNGGRGGGWKGGEELVVRQNTGIMASIVSRHPPTEEYQTDHDLPMPYQRLRDVGKLLPLDFPNRT